MSKKYVFKSGFLTICFCEIVVFMLLQLWNQVLHHRLVTSLPLMQSSSCIVHLLDDCHTFFVFSFKSVRIFLGAAKLFVMSITLFFSVFSRSARRWPTNFGANSWLWIPQSIAIHQYFVSLSKKTFQPKRTFTFPWARSLKVRFLPRLKWLVFTTPFTLHRQRWPF